MYIVLGIAVALVMGTVGVGVLLTFQDYLATRTKLKKALRYNLFVFIPLFLMAVLGLVPDISLAAAENPVSASGLGFIAAALCTGLATIGAGYAVGAVGSSALGAVSEDPKILGKTLIFVGLAEGIAIYGLIISILILGRL